MRGHMLSEWRERTGQRWHGVHPYRGETYLYPWVYIVCFSMAETINTFAGTTHNASYLFLAWPTSIVTHLESASNLMHNDRGAGATA